MKAATDAAAAAKKADDDKLGATKALEQADEIGKVAAAAQINRCRALLAKRQSPGLDQKIRSLANVRQFHLDAAQGFDDLIFEQ